MHRVLNYIIFFYYGLGFGESVSVSEKYYINRWWYQPPCSEFESLGR